MMTTPEAQRAYMRRKFAELDAATPEAPSLPTLSPYNFYEVYQE